MEGTRHSLWAVDIHPPILLLGGKKKKKSFVDTDSAPGKQENPAVFDTKLDQQSNLM